MAINFSYNYIQFSKSSSRKNHLALNAPYNNSQPESCKGMFQDENGGNTWEYLLDFQYVTESEIQRCKWLKNHYSYHPYLKNNAIL